MNHVFKLSRRLAVARVAPLAVLALAACDTVDPLGSGEGTEGKLLTLSPARATAEPYQTIKLAFRDQLDGTAEPSYDVQWTVIGGGGSIAPDGSFTATAPGVYSILGAKGNGKGGGNNGNGKGNGGSNNQTDTSIVVVVPPPPAILAIEVTPATSSIDAGGHLQFDAVGRDADGATVALGVEWAANGGSIDAGGLYIAGSTGGTYRVVARHAGSGLADTAAVVVQAAPAPAPDTTSTPTPAPAPAPAPAPPSGNDGSDLPLISERRFDAKTESGWLDRGDTHFSIVRKAAARSPDNVGQALFPQGYGSGSGPISTWLPLGNDRRELHVSFDVQLSANWDGNDAGVNKIFFIWMHGKPVVCLSAQGVGANPLMAQVRLQDTPAGARNLSPNLAAGNVARGAWTRWDIRLISNTPGVADGQIHWWVNGKKVGEYRDVMFAGAGQSNTWEQLMWNPTYGGAGDPVPADQYMWMDHVTVSGR